MCVETLTIMMADELLRLGGVHDQMMAALDLMGHHF
jgi:hypothetical protein